VFFPEISIPSLKEFGRGSTLLVEGAFFKTADGHSMFRAKSTHIVGAPTALDRFRTRCRRAVVSVFAKNNDEQNGDWGGLALALLLGVRDNLDSGLAEQYRNAGCSYILALSGMHLAIVSALVALLLKKPCGLHAATALNALFIAFYVFLVGAQPSLMRAAIMAFLTSAAVFFSLPKNPLQIFAAAFIAQIAFTPAAGTSVSFLLSYCALLGILTLSYPLAETMRGALPTFLAEPLAASIAAFCATLSLTAFFFGALRPVGIAAGLIAVPLTTVFMALALGYLIFVPIFPLAAVPLHTPLSFVYRALEKIMYTASKVPAIEIPSLGLPALLALSFVPFALLALCVSIQTRRRRIIPFDAACLPAAGGSCALRD
jgi:competence protein ComEC